MPCEFRRGLLREFLLFLPTGVRDNLLELRIGLFLHFQDGLGLVGRRAIPYRECKHKRSVDFCFFKQNCLI